MKILITPPKIDDLRRILRASGFVTNGQAYDLAVVINQFLHYGDVQGAIRAAEDARDNHSPSDKIKP